MTEPLFDSPLPLLSLEAGAGRLQVDLTGMLDQGAFIQGAPRSGKSWLIRSLAEQAFPHVQQFLFDIEGEYATLTENFDFALFSQQAALAPDPASAGLLCRRLMGLGVSAIFDLSSLTLPDRQTFVRGFLDALMALPDAEQHECLCFFDEAQQLFPQASLGSAESVDAGRDLCARGGKRGYGRVLATQRASSLDTPLRGLLTNKVIGLTPLGTDLAAAADMLGMGKAEARRLAELDRGEFFVYGPAISPREVVLARSGPVVTPHLSRKQIRAFTPPPATEALRSLYEQMREAQEQTAAEKSGALSEAQAGTGGNKPAPRTVIQYVDVPVLREGEAERLAALAADMIGMGKELVAGAQEIQNALFAAKRLIPEESPLLVVPGDDTPPDEVPEDKFLAPDQGRDPALPSELPGSRRRILDTLAEMERMGVARPLREHVAIFADLSPTSSGYGQHLTALRADGLLEYPSGGRLALTPQGRAIAAAPGRLLTRAELQDRWLRRLPVAQARILRALIAASPSSLKRADLAGRAGASVTSSAFGQNLTDLRALGLVAYPRPGQVAATTLLFPPDLR